MSVLGLSLLVGCGGGGTTLPVAPAYSAAGTWRGSIQNQNNNNFTLAFTANLNDTNGTITGTASFDLQPGNLTEIKGTRNTVNNTAQLSVTIPQGNILITGTFAGKTFSGNYAAVGDVGAGPVSMQSQ